MNVLNKFFQHNWWAIFYFNFKMLPLKQAIYLPFDFYHKVRFDNLSGKIKILGNVQRAMVKFGTQGSDMFQRNGCILSIEGDVVFNGSCVFGCTNLLKVKKGGILEIGDNCIFGANNIIYVEKKISIADDFLSSWNCQFMDSDTHTIIDLNTKDKLRNVIPVIIGHHCWVGNHVIVNKGVILPDNTIVASNSLVNKKISDIPENCILAGVPAKIVKQNMKWEI